MFRPARVSSVCLHTEGGEERAVEARAVPDGTRAETRFRISHKRTSPF